MLATLAVQEHAQRDIGMPAEAWGLLSFGILVALLVATLIFGKGRPHS